ncbi:MAG: leucyl aminopeptidase [Bacillota bacterium]|jgi:leucyl aminopeptidase|nr:leucyl aminopeptidase [Bacillota bacterium]NLJ02265.1 leucyl aminopeptidase [Bacillota bacterium]
MEVRALEYSADLASDLLLFVAEDDMEGYSWPNAAVKALAEDQGFTGKFGELAFCAYFAEGEEKPRKAIVTGLGKLSELCLEKVRKACGKALKEADRRKIKSLSVSPWTYDVLEAADAARAVTEAACLAGYRFNRYLSEKKEFSVESLQVCYEPSQEVDVIRGLKLGRTLGEATNLARDLVNEPANTMTPEQLAKEAVEAGEKYGFAVEVLEEDAIRELGMTAFLEVGKASANRPRLIIMRHQGNPDHPEQVLGLVGKGLTFDSGGLSLKPAQGMGAMKSDMGGAASVIGAMCAIAESKLRLNAVAVVAACENLISGEGYRPGDIITSMSGKTIQIDSTDAEGRLTLADAVYYMVTKEKADPVVDVATLTGAAIIALGNTTTAVLTNRDELYQRLQGASEKSGERIWQLPNFPEYREQNKTPQADLKNTGGRPAGTITAGLFIEAFVEETPWLHLDIAGTSYAEKAGDYLTEGATGVGVRLLYHFAESFI